MTPWVACDADQAERAQTSVINPITGAHLTLCGHHLRRHQDALEAAGFTYVAPATDDLGAIDYALNH